jgi:hypothetical protein
LRSLRVILRLSTGDRREKPKKQGLFGMARYGNGRAIPNFKTCPIVGRVFQARQYRPETANQTDGDLEKQVNDCNGLAHKSIRYR